MDLDLQKEGPIGVFDSGVGGIGTLKEMVRVLPCENFIFYGDSLHAPYGEKTPEQVLALVEAIIDHLLAQKVKAIAIACNTATSVAAATLRQRYPQLPIIGIEPAIKMAISAEKRNRVLVMATPMTLQLDKYQLLQRRLEDQADYIPLECPGLAKRIEQGNLDAADLTQMLQGFLAPYRGRVDSVVLGCTHYPFVKKQVREIMGGVPVFDGGRGTALQLQRVLKAQGLLSSRTEPGAVTFESSKQTQEEQALYRQLYDLYELA